MEEKEDVRHEHNFEYHHTSDGEEVYRCECGEEIAEFIDSQP